MKMNFDIEKLKTILINFYNLTHVRFVIYDDEFNKILAYPEDSCNFCRIIKSNPESKEKCRKNDISACEICQETGTLYMYKCHCGLVEVVAPIKMNDIIIGYIMFGQICEKGTDKTDILNYAVNFSRDNPDLEQAVKKLVCKSEKQIKAAANILEICTCYLWLYELIRIDSENPILSISGYIDMNLSEDLSVEHLCSVFGINRSRLYDIFKNYYGIGVATYIRKKRIEHAKECFRQGITSVRKVSSMSGFMDCNYFSKIFKNETGVTPKEYKNNLINNDGNF